MGLLSKVTGGLASGMGKSAPKQQPKTAEEVALQNRQRIELDKETSESEKRLKAMARNKLGSQSLLSGAPSTSFEAATGAKRGSGGGGSLLPGRGRRSGGGGSGGGGGGSSSGGFTSGSVK